MTVRTDHYLLVSISWPSGVDTQLAAEMVEAAIQQAIDDGRMMTMSGCGPNPPYERHPDYLVVFPDERP